MLRFRTPTPVVPELPVANASVIGTKQPLAEILATLPPPLYHQNRVPADIPWPRLRHILVDDVPYVEPEDVVNYLRHGQFPKLPVDPVELERRREQNRIYNQNERAALQRRVAEAEQALQDFEREHKGRF